MKLLVATDGSKASLKAVKYWPTVGRVDNVYGDRNLLCSCVPIADLADA